MAHQTEIGTYIHPPKTGGVSFRSYLVEQFGEYEEVGKFHGIPFDAQIPYITTVRHPVDWMDSVFRYRQHQGWCEKDEGIGWDAIIALTQWAKHLTWSTFVQELYRRDVDIPYIVFGLFTSAAHAVFQIENVPYLDALGNQIRRNITPIRSTIRVNERLKLEHAFRRSIAYYGYDFRVDAGCHNLCADVPVAGKTLGL